MTTESTTKEHPILFSAEMVKAVLAGTKTMTRRVCKGARELSCALDWPVESCPYGQVGGRLWVRETWDSAHDNVTGTAIFYKADFNDTVPKGDFTWRPPIFMPRWASRITLEITNISVERLQDITAGDCVKEGSYMATDKDDEGGFINLWDSINGKTYPWESNPWCWVIEFKKVQL